MTAEHNRNIALPIYSSAVTIQNVPLLNELIRDWRVSDLSQLFLKEWNMLSVMAEVSTFILNELTYALELRPQLILNKLK